MVGYRQEETLSEPQKLLAGVVAGITTRFLTQPLDVLKLKLQLRKRVPKKPLVILRTTFRIFKEEGLTAFWQGHSVAQLHSILSVSAQLYCYEWCTQHIVKTNIKESYKAPLVFLTGVFAGCVSATLVLPLDVMRVRQVLIKEQYGGFAKGIKNIYKQGGILSFYEGWTASMLQIGPAAGINFCVFRWMQPIVLMYLGDCKERGCVSAGGNYTENRSHLLLASSISGTMSGFVSKTLTYPFDLAKRRLQISSHKRDLSIDVPSTSKNLRRCSTLFLCLTKTIKHEGLFGLYRGWGITVFKAQVTSLITFTTYEFVCHLIREYSYVRDD